MEILAPAVCDMRVIVALGRRSAGLRRLLRPCFLPIQGVWRPIGEIELQVSHLIRHTQLARVENRARDTRCGTNDERTVSTAAIEQVDHQRNHRRDRWAGSYARK